MCSLFESLEGPRGTRDMTMAPRLVYSALSAVQESGKGIVAGSIDTADSNGCA